MTAMKISQHPVVRILLPVGTRRRRIVSRGGHLVWPLPWLRKPPTVDRDRQEEEAKLTGVWRKHRPDMLDIYLVSGFQDPRLNAQSIIGRHTLIRALFDSEFEPLMREELAHAAELNDAIRLRGLELGVTLTATMDQE